MAEQPVLPSWLGYTTLRDAAGQPTATTIYELPLLYTGPSIPLTWPWTFADELRTATATIISILGQPGYETLMADAAMATTSVTSAAMSAAQAGMAAPATSTSLDTGQQGQTQTVDRQGPSASSTAAAPLATTATGTTPQAVSPSPARATASPMAATTSRSTVSTATTPSSAVLTPNRITALPGASSTTLPVIGTEPSSSPATVVTTTPLSVQLTTRPALSSSTMQTATAASSPSVTLAGGSTVPGSVSTRPNGMVTTVPLTPTTLPNGSTTLAPSLVPAPRAEANLSAGQIAGITVGSVAAASLMSLFLLCFSLGYRRRYVARRHGSSNSSHVSSWAPIGDAGYQDDPEMAERYRDEPLTTPSSGVTGTSGSSGGLFSGWSSSDGSSNAAAFVPRPQYTPSSGVSRASPTDRDSVISYATRRTLSRVPPPRFLPNVNVSDGASASLLPYNFDETGAPTLPPSEDDERTPRPKSSGIMGCAGLPPTRPPSPSIPSSAVQQPTMRSVDDGTDLSAPLDVPPRWGLSGIRVSQKPDVSTIGDTPRNSIMTADDDAYQTAQESAQDSAQESLADVSHPDLPLMLASRALAGRVLSGLGLGRIFLSDADHNDHPGRLSLRRAVADNSPTLGYSRRPSLQRQTSKDEGEASDADETDEKTALLQGDADAKWNQGMSGQQLTERASTPRRSWTASIRSASHHSPGRSRDGSIMSRRSVSDQAPVASQARKASRRYGLQPEKAEVNSYK